MRYVGVGGLIGMVLLGLFASKAVNPAGAGGLHTYAVECLAAGVAVVWSFGMTWVIVKAIDRTVGMRVTPEDEFTVLTQQAESAYPMGGTGRISG